MTQISKLKYSSKISLFFLRALTVFILSSEITLSPVIAAEANSENPVELKVPKKKNPTINLDYTQIQPAGIGGRASSEYYSTLPDAKLLVPIHVWGEIKEPGMHFVPLGSSVSEAISSSGGPLTTASMPEVVIRRKNEPDKEVDLFKTGLNEKVSAHDTIVVQRSMKADLPLYFGGISILISLASFVILLTKIK